MLSWANLVPALTSRLAMLFSTVFARVLYLLHLHTADLHPPCIILHQNVVPQCFCYKEINVIMLWQLWSLRFPDVSLYAMAI